MKYFGYILFLENLNSVDSKLFKKKMIISTINPYAFLIAEKNKLFKQALQDSDILLPDGIGIVWAVKFLYKIKIKKIAGYDLFLFLMDKLNKHKGKVFFLGSTNETLASIKNKCAIEYPNITVGTYSPPFKEEFDNIDNGTIINKIEKFNPDVLFVGMTAPKQEIWVYKNKLYLNVKTIASIGAVFDFYAGKIKRPSKFWIDLGLEWLIRFLQEPNRLFKRNFIFTPLFILKIIYNYVKLKYFEKEH